MVEPTMRFRDSTRVLAEPRDGPAGSGTLTARQREVLALLARGKTVKQIAYELNIGVKTVQTHKARIVGRIGVLDASGLARCASRLGLVEP